MAKIIEEQVPFLVHDSELQHSKKSRRLASPWLSTSRGLATVLFVLLLANLTTLAANLKVRSRSGSDSIHESLLSDHPLNHLVEYEDKYFHTSHITSPYAGQPRPEFDDAWDKLLNNTIVEVTADELRAINRTSLQLEGSGNYLAYLEVYHQLHCVKRIVQMRHREYYPHLVETDKLNEEHFDHCIDLLRQLIMCRGDLQINTFVWHETPYMKFEVNPNDLHRCVNWDRIEDWTKSRFPGQHYEIVKQDGVGIQGPVD